MLGQIEKLLEHLKSKPKDFTFDEVEKLLNSFGYKLYNKGKTSGSRIAFLCDEHPTILLHKAHQRKELLEYQVKQLLEILKSEKSYRGSFNVRISLELHKKAVIAATSKQMFLNNFVETSIKQAIITE